MVHAIRIILVAMATGSLLAATGCASGSKKINPERQAAIHKVSVAKSVPVPETPRVMGPSISAGSFFVGPLALLGAASKDNPDSQALLRHFADHQIDLGAIVRREFVAGLVQIRAFPEIDVAQADAGFEVTVEDYGLGPAGFTPMSPVNHPLNPNLRLTAKLTSASGEVLWQNTAYLTSFTDRIEAHELHEILANPERTREAFRKAAEIVCEDLLRDFDAHPAPVRQRTASVSGPAAAGGSSPARPTTAALTPAPVAALRDSGSAPISPADGHLPTVGTTWIYRLQDRIYGGSRVEIQIRVQSHDDASVSELITTGVGSSRRDVIIANAQVLQVSLGGNASALELAPYLLARGDEGVSLTGRAITGYPHGNSGLPAWNIRVTRGVWKPVGVAAGGYLALRVQIDGKRERPELFRGEVGQFRIVAWYAPEVKRLVKLEHQTWEMYSGQLNEHTVLELTSFRPAF